MAIYNLRTLGTYYQITKFDDDLNVESTYEASEAKCNCPAGSRGNICRHRKMIPVFISHQRVDGEWFLDYDNNKWVHPWSSIEETPRAFKRRI